MVERKSGRRARARSLTDRLEEVRGRGPEGRPMPGEPALTALSVGEPGPPCGRR